MTQKRLLRQLRRTSETEGEEIPLKEEENINKSSAEDKEMYSWDEIEHKVNYVQFLSNKTVTEKQMQVASAMIDKLEEPVYDHRTRIKERSQPL